jgi:hypothetical protein
MESSQFLAYLRSRLAEAQREVDVWQAALDAETKSKSSQRSSFPVRPARAGVSPARSIPASLKGKPTAYIKQLLAQKGKAGITPAEIRARAKVDYPGEKHSGHFPYNHLAKLKESKQVQVKDGRYYLAARKARS